MRSYNLKVVLFIASIVLGAILGFIGGIVAYFFSFYTMRLNDLQSKVVIIGFTVLGLCIGIYGACRLPVIRRGTSRKA